MGHVGTIDGNATVNGVVKRSFGAATNATTKGSHPGSGVKSVPPVLHRAMVMLMNAP